MPEYLSPGVYLEEIEVGPKPIEGVATSNLGMLGPTERGPEEVRLIGSWLEFERLYGLPIPGWHLANAVKGFFDNGGKRCFVARVVDNAATPAGETFDGLIIDALGPGAYGGNVLVRITDPTLAGPEQFNLAILYFRDGIPNPFVDPTDRDQLANSDRVEPTLIESYQNVSAVAGTQNEVVRALAGSSLIRARWDPTTQREKPQNTPNGATANFTALSGGTGDPSTIDLADFRGRDRTVPRADGNLEFGSGLLGLGRVDEISILAAPDQHNGQAVGIDADLLTQCETLRDRFGVLSVPAGQRDPTAIDILPRSTLYGGLYWPWIRVRDLAGDPALVPPVGHVAGIMARTDIDRGVHKPPANAVVRGAIDLEFTVSRTQQDILNPKGVNVIRDFRSDGRGIRLWGARTMAADPSWKYVNVRRTFLFLEESIDEGTQWVVFEPNNEALWDRVRRSIENFLITVWRNGALMGTSQDEAFYVKCDRTTMTQDDIDNGRLICYIGVAVVKPAEFVIFRIHQWTAGAETAV